MTVRKKSNIRNRYNQAPQLTQDTIWESDNKTSHIFSHFPAGDHKAARSRQDSMTTQIKIGFTKAALELTGQFDSTNLTLISYVDQDT